MKKIKSSVLVVLSVAIAGVFAQPDEQECDNNGAYDTSTGTATCNGVQVNFFSLVCGDQFDQSKCVASWTNNNGQEEEYFIMGAGSGISSEDLPQECSSSFSATGLAMVQYYPSGSGCYPAADLAGTTATYSSSGSGVDSVTLNFQEHDDGVTVRDGYIKITCGSDTGGFTTSGDSKIQSKYEVEVKAPCGDAPNPPPTPPPNPPPNPPPTPPPNPSPNPPPSPGTPTPPPSASQHVKKSVPVGMILDILFFVVLTSYFVAGFLFLWKVKHVEGWDRVPNKEFWVSLPGLIKDGFLFTKAKITRSEYQRL